MRSGSQHGLRAIVPERLSRFHQRSGGVDHIVYDQRRAPLNLAYDVQHFDFAQSLVVTALVDDRQLRPQAFRISAGAFDASRIGCDHRQVRQLQRVKVSDQHRGRKEVVSRYVKEPLNLTRVQIEKQHAIGPRF